jgi:hypothetical protein
MSNLSEISSSASSFYLLRLVISIFFLPLSQNEEKKSLLVKACATHSLNIRKAMAGEGTVDFILYSQPLVQLLVRGLLLYSDVNPTLYNPL